MFRKDYFVKDLDRVFNHKIYRWIIPIFLLILALVYVIDSSKIVPVAACIALTVLVCLVASITRGLGCGMSILEFFIIAAILAILASIIVPNYDRVKEDGNFSACMSTMHYTAIAIDEYYTENHVLPQSLGSLTPRYLRELPRCPSGNNTTYKYIHHNEPKIYTLYCLGTQHAKAAVANYPQYRSSNVFVEPPHKK
jgi:Tfp pilus assembly protein PilE